MKKSSYELETYHKCRIFVFESTSSVIHSITGSSGKYLSNHHIIMNNQGYDINGDPVDYIDENGIHWYYVGKGQDGGDEWLGRSEVFF